MKLAIDQGMSSILGLPKTNKKSNIPVEKSSTAQTREIRKYGLCCYYVENWNVGHKCKTPMLYLMEVIQLFMKEKKGVQIEELQDEGKENL